MIDQYSIWHTGSTPRPPLGIIRREVLPVLHVRLELLAFFGGISALSFWVSMTW